MIKVTMEYENILKYFTFVNETGVIHPCNKEIMKYMKNFTNWCDSDGAGDQFFTFLSKEYHEYEEKAGQLVERGDYFVFEFPDEETVFYFKMKFC